MPPATPLIKGTLDVLVLKALCWGAMHGALYQALHRMEERRLIKAEWGITDNNRRARYYTLTPGGRAHLRSEAGALLRYARTVTAILTEQPA